MQTFEARAVLVKFNYLWLQGVVFTDYALSRSSLNKQKANTYGFLSFVFMYRKQLDLWFD